MTDEQFEKIVAGQASLETEMRILNKRLFGNGQPGSLMILHNNHEELDSRVGKLEQKTAVTDWKLGSISAGAGAALAIAAQFVLRKIGY